MKKLFTLLTLLVAIVTGAQAGVTKTHTPGTYESATGYNTALTVYDDNKYEVYYVSYKSSKAYLAAGKSYVTDNNAYCLINGATTSTTDGIDFSDGWGNIISAAFSGSNTSPKEEWAVSATNNSTHYVPLTSSSSITLKVSGYDQFSFAGRDGNKNAESGQFIVTIDGKAQTMTHTTTDWSIYRFDISTDEHTIVITGDNSSTGSRFRGFSLRVPAGAITPTITTETATVEEGKTVSALDFITAKNGTNTLTDVTYSNFAVSAGSEYVSVAADGTITGLTGGAGHTATITFDSDAVTDKYEKTEGNELTVNVVAAKQELTLAYSGDVELTAGQTFTPATLTATAGGNTVDVATLGLTYESSNTDLATVNATTGEVTLVAKATGTATIKAKLRDNATYSDTEASYTITVNKIPVPKFYIDGVEIANGATVADFTTGQTIVIEAPGYYIYSNWSGSDSKPKSDYYKDGGVKGQDSYKASTLSTGKRVLYAVAGDDEHAQGNSSDLAKVIFSNVTAGSIEVSISAAGYATLYYSSLPLAVPANVTAKTYKVDNGNIVVSKTYAAESVIPQGEPVVLEGAAGDYTFTVKKDESATKDANSMLKGLDAAGQTTGEGLFYKLAQKDGKVGFYWGAAEGAAFALQGDHHAYLVVPTSTGAREFYAFSEEVSTGINSANVQTVNDNAPIYNLAGQKVSKGYKGIVIVNGRKMLNK